MDERRFRRCTISEYLRLCDQLRRKERRNLQPIAQVCAILAQVHSKKKFSANDFLPPEPQVDTRHKSILTEAQSPEQMYQVLQFLYGDSSKN